MAVGFPVNKSVIDERAGGTALALRRALADAANMKAWLDGKTVQELQDLGYTAEEAAILKDSFTDLDKLARVATGAATQGAANDFFWNARKLIGVN